MTDYTDMPPRVVIRPYGFVSVPDDLRAEWDRKSILREQEYVRRDLYDALTAERDALQAHIAQEAEFLATVTAAKHEAEREVERLRDLLDEAPAHVSTETLDAIRRNARKAAAAQDKAVREWAAKP